MKSFTGKKVYLASVLMALFVVSQEKSYSIDKGYSLGGGSYAKKDSATAIGRKTQAIEENATAIGNLVTATGENSTAVGSQSNAEGKDSTVLGYMANAVGEGSTALGEEAGTSDAYSTAVGHKAHATNTGTTALGHYTDATGYESTAVGQAAKAEGKDSTAVGQRAQAFGDYSTVLGRATKADKTSVAIGEGAEALKDERGYLRIKGIVVDGKVSEHIVLKLNGKGKVIGKDQKEYDYDKEKKQLYLTTDLDREKPGMSPLDSNFENLVENFKLEGATAVGYMAEARTNNAVAIGNRAQALEENSVALGANAITGKAVSVEKVSINNVEYGGFAGSTANSVVSIGCDEHEITLENGNKAKVAAVNRQIQHVAAGRIDANSTDAVNGSQVFVITDKISNELDTKANKADTYTKAEVKKELQAIFGKIDKKANKTGDNITDKETWKNNLDIGTGTIGTGRTTDNNTVTGAVVKKFVEDKNYITTNEITNDLVNDKLNKQGISGDNSIEITGNGKILDGTLSVSLKDGSIGKGKLDTELSKEIDSKADKATTYTKTEVDKKIGEIDVSKLKVDTSKLANKTGDNITDKETWKANLDIGTGTIGSGKTTDNNTVTGAVVKKFVEDKNYITTNEITNELVNEKLNKQGITGDNSIEITGTGKVLDGSISVSLKDGSIGKEKLDTELSNLINSKASKKELENGLGKKADKTYVTTELEKKADKNYITSELGKKADATALNTKADKADTYTKKEVDQKIGEIDVSKLKVDTSKLANKTGDNITDKEIWKANLDIGTGTIGTGEATDNNTVTGAVVKEYVEGKNYITTNDITNELVNDKINKQGITGDNSIEITGTGKVLDGTLSVSLKEGSIGKGKLNTELSNLIDSKASKEELNNGLGKKADKTYVTTELEKKADKNYVTSELGKKADATALNTKADKADTYTKKEVDKKIQNIDLSSVKVDTSKLANVNGDNITNKETWKANLDIGTGTIGTGEATDNNTVTGAVVKKFVEDKNYITESGVTETLVNGKLNKQEISGDNTIEITGTGKILDGTLSVSLKEGSIGKGKLNTELSNLIDSKASKEELNNGLANKADKNYVSTELEKKADKNYVTTELSKKADATALNTKADKATTYTKDEVDKKIGEIDVSKLKVDTTKLANVNGDNITNKETWKSNLDIGTGTIGTGAATDNNTVTGVAVKEFVEDKNYITTNDITNDLVNNKLNKQGISGDNTIEITGNGKILDGTLSVSLKDGSIGKGKLNTELSNLIDSKASKEEVASDLVKKADKNYVTSELSKKADATALDTKADKATTYTKDEVDQKIQNIDVSELKVDTTKLANVNGDNITDKETWKNNLDIGNGTIGTGEATDNNTVTGAVVKKFVEDKNYITESGVTDTLVNSKLNKQEISGDNTIEITGNGKILDGTLNVSLKAGSIGKGKLDTELSNLIDSKASKEELNNELGKKADKTFVSTELGKKADKTYVTSELAKKADKSYITTELNKVDSKLSEKADKVTTYTKDEVDNKIENIDITKLKVDEAKKAIFGTNVGIEKIEVDEKTQEVKEEDKNKLVQAQAVKDYVDGVVNRTEELSEVAVYKTVDNSIEIQRNTEAIERNAKAIDRVSQKVDRAGALSAALAGLHPMQYDPLNPNQIMAALGAYRDKQAVAVGATHYFNENVSMSAAVSVGTETRHTDVMGNVGVTYKFGEEKDDRRNINSLGENNGKQLTSIYILQTEMQKTNYKDKTQDEKILEQEKKIEKLNEKIEKLEKALTKLNK